MVDLQKPTISRDTPKWLPIAATAGVLLLFVAAVFSMKVLLAVFVCALTAALIYVAVWFTCHVIALINDVTAGLGTLFQSWR
ncbi:MAG: hypothetical protein GY798_31415 [Hyphomicrobiales bacterium]|nr:hypothetical protein [Hyphomicrobiales bacterium]